MKETIFAIVLFASFSAFAGGTCENTAVERVLGSTETNNGSGVTVKSIKLMRTSILEGSRL
jgi:hypothetical protein